jgi:putative glutamine amidotransferase
MTSRPIILVTPSTQAKGVEMSDYSISLSNRYTEAVIAAGGLPVVSPATTNKEILAEMVRRVDGVMLTGGDDISPKLYKAPAKLAKKAGAPEPERDIWEPTLIAEIFEHRKPLLGICRGHQMLNVALGGTLIVDIPSQKPKAFKHQRSDKKSEPVHDIEIEKDSLLADIVGSTTLAVNSTHHQAFGRVAAALKVVARSEDGIVEAAELSDSSRLPFCVTVQFHPERLVDKGRVYGQIFERFIAACATSRRH